MREPSKKQTKFAEDIRHWTGVEFPEEYTAQAFWQYINENKPKYEEKKRKECEYWSKVQAEDKEKKAADRRYRESHWAATHLDAKVFMDKVKEGEYDLPFWMR